MTHFRDFENSNVIFFDGYCFLCNRIVDFLISKDRNQLLQFASIQSEFASKMFSFQQMFIPEDQKFSTVVFLQKGEIKTKSEAVIAIIFLGIVVSVFSIYIWNAGIRSVGANKASIFLNLIPVFGAILAIIFLQSFLVNSIGMLATRLQ